MPPSTAPAAGPLAGMRVIELGTLIAGPFCTRVLAEFGAEVIKIEAPDGGDPLRTWRKVHDGTSLWWFVQARNKKSVTVNLKSPAGQEVVRKLEEGADPDAIEERLGGENPCSMPDPDADLPSETKKEERFKFRARPVAPVRDPKLYDYE